GNAGTQRGGAGDRGVLLLNETLSQFHEGAILVRAITIEDVLRFLLSIIDFFPVPQLAQLSPDARGVSAGTGLTHIQTNQRLLEFDIMQLHACVLVESRIMS